MEKENSESRSYKGYFFIALATILFSTMEISLKTCSGDFNPVQLTMIRFLVGGAALTPFAVSALKKKKERIDMKVALKLIWISCIGLFIGMNLFQLAIEYTNASTVSVLFSTNTLFVTILASLILNERIKKSTIIAIFFQIVGVIIIIRPWNVKINLVGVMMALASAGAFALYGVLGKEESNRFGGLVTTWFCSLSAGIEMLLYVAISHLGPVSAFLKGRGLGSFADIPLWTGFSMSNLPVILYTGIFVTGCGYLSYFMAMEHLPAQTVSLVFFFKPMLAPVLAMLVLGEVIPFNMAMGIMMILAGSFISLFAGRLAIRIRSLREL